MMKRKSRSSREAMERTEFSREATRLDREFQYLGDRPVNMSAYAKKQKQTNIYPSQIYNILNNFFPSLFTMFLLYLVQNKHTDLFVFTVQQVSEQMDRGGHNHCSPKLCLIFLNIKNVSINLVILKIRSKRTQRNTEMPRGDMILVSTRMVSRIPPHTTKLSKRLKSDTKYACGE